MSATNDLLPSLALLACAWLVLALLTSAATALVWPMLQRRSQAWHPRDRARVAFWVAIAPAVFPTGVLLICVAPGLVGFVTGTGDHCHLHPDHAHLCLLHASVDMSMSLWSGALLVLAGLGRAIWSGARWGRDTRAAAQLLCGEAQPRWEGRVGRVDTDQPFAFTGGFLRPRVWISKGLERSLSPAEREVVLAHELAHRERRDPARFALAGLLSELHAPATGRSILSTLRLAAEQACDEQAAERVGSRLDVAETLLRVERLIRTRGLESAPLHAALVGSTLAARVQSLLGDPPPRTGTADGWGVLVALLGASVLAAAPAHHAAEHVLELVTGLF